MTTDNPFFQSWNTPYGAPPFDLIKPEHFLPAFERGMAESAADIEAIANNSEAPTFENTMIPLQMEGRLLERVSTVFFCLSGAHTNDELDAIETEIMPKLTAHSNLTTQNAKLFARIKAVYEARDQLAPQARRVTEQTYRGFIKSGAALDEAQKKHIGDLQVELSKLSTQFDQNVMAEEKAFSLPLVTDADKAGLPASYLQSAEDAAKDRGLAGAVVTLGMSSRETFLTLSARRDLREKIYNAWKARGAQGNENDNSKVIEAIAARRHELAQAMGYATYADYQLDDKMAKTPANVTKLLNDVWPPARTAMLTDQQMLEESARADGLNDDLKPWDWWYYAEKVRQQKYDVNEQEVRQYLLLENTIKAAFYTAGQLFGLNFTERHDLPTWHADVRTWEVTNKDGQHVALFYGDYFARPSKQGGAWMSELREQNALETQHKTPIIYNVCNFSKGDPALISLEDYNTLFHEFGHALHGMLSRAEYPALAGTRVLHDFVELPSQLYERWALTDEVLTKFALHHETGAIMPQELRDKIRAADTFNQGFRTAEYIASTTLDMKWHTQSSGTATVAEIEAATVRDLDLPAIVTPRHKSTHFGHIARGYAAGYYGYLWADVLVSDAFDAFEETGNVFHGETARRLHDYIYAAGDTVAPDELYRQFRGRDATVAPLLKSRGFVANDPAVQNPEAPVQSHHG